MSALSVAMGGGFVGIGTLIFQIVQAWRHRGQDNATEDKTRAEEAQILVGSSMTLVKQLTDDYEKCQKRCAALQLEVDALKRRLAEAGL